MDRKDVQYAYMAFPTEKRRELANFMNHSMAQQYQYFLNPSSNKIGKDRLNKYLTFMPESEWLKWAVKGKAMIIKETSILELNYAGIQEPDEIILNGIHYKKT